MPTTNDPVISRPTSAALTDTLLGNVSGETSLLTLATLKTSLVLAKADVGLGNVDNTTDLGKPISTATQTALNGKQPLSAALTGTTASFTTALETKLAGIEPGATADMTGAEIAASLDAAIGSGWRSVGVGGGDALVAQPLSQFAATTSAQLAGVISDETGTGALVFANSPTLVTPNLGTPSAITLTNATGLPWSTGVTGKPTTLSGYGITDASASSHNHTGVYQPLATVLTNTTASFTTALEAKLNALPTGVIVVSANRALAATDANQVLQVANGVALTLDSGSLANAGEIGSMMPAVGATYTLVVGTATIRTRTGGPALAAAAVVSSSQAQDGEIVLRKESDGSYLLLAPKITGLGSQVTASGALPARTTEDLQIVEVNSASAVALTMSAGQFLKSPKPRGYLLVNKGAGVLSVSGLTTRPASPPTCAQYQRMPIVSDPSVDDQPWVSVG